MKTVAVNEGSWHYRLATCFDRPIRYQQDNICAYTRKMLTGLLMLSMLVGLVVIAFWTYGDILGWAVACIVHAQWLEPHGVCVIGFAVLLLAICIGVGAWVTMLKDDNKIPKMPPIIADAWESFHDKVCFQIEVKP